MPKKSTSPAEQVTDEQVLAAASEADRDQVVAAVGRWHESDRGEPCRALLDGLDVDDPAHPFHPEAEKFAGKFVSASGLKDAELEIHRVGLRAMARWNRAARLAAEDGTIAAESVSGLLGDPLAGL